MQQRCSSKATATGALTALAGLGESHGALALARASAALIGDSREALEAAKKELASYRVTPVGKDDPEASSLLMRVDLRLGANVESLLPAARALVVRAPGNPASHLALATALVAAGQGVPAIEALEPALRLVPGNADAHYLLGQAQRLAGRPNEARLSFERAVAIAQNHVEARRALGRTLLDGGEFDAALALFRGLEGVAGNVATLGIAEALIAKGSAADAAQLLSGLPPRSSCRCLPGSCAHAYFCCKSSRSRPSRCSSRWWPRTRSRAPPTHWPSTATRCTRPTK